MVVPFVPSTAEAVGTPPSPRDSPLYSNTLWNLQIRQYWIVWCLHSVSLGTLFSLIKLVLRLYYGFIVIRFVLSSVYDLQFHTIPMVWELVVQIKCSRYSCRTFFYIWWYMRKLAQTNCSRFVATEWLWNGKGMKCFLLCFIQRRRDEHAFEWYFYVLGEFSLLSRITKAFSFR